MKYSGIDLHSNNCIVGEIDEQDRLVTLNKKMRVCIYQTPNPELQANPVCVGNNDTPVPKPPDLRLFRVWYLLTEPGSSARYSSRKLA